MIVDGRHARSAQSSDAIVEALLALVREGGLPSSDEIARRAGVSQRTLFNRFADMPALLTEAVERQVAHLHEILPTPARGGSIEERVTAYVTALSRVLDEIAAVRWAVLTYPQPSPALSKGLRRVRAMTRGRIAALVPGAPPEAVAALEVATDPLTWRLLRVQHGLGRERAARVVLRTALAIVRSIPTPGTTGRRSGCREKAAPAARSREAGGPS